MSITPHFKALCTVGCHLNLQMIMPLCSSTILAFCAASPGSLLLQAVTQTLSQLQQVQAPPSQHLKHTPGSHTPHSHPSWAAAAPAATSPGAGGSS